MYCDIKIWGLRSLMWRDHDGGHGIPVSEVGVGAAHSWYTGERGRRGGGSPRAMARMAVQWRVGVMQV